MIKKIFSKTILLLLLSIILVIPTFSKLLRPGYFPMHDDMQAMRLLQIDKCIKDKQFPCRWVPDMGYGYGYPQFNYYGPLPYYVMEVFHLLGLSFLDSVKAGFILPVIVSVVGMFFLGSSLWGPLAGLISAILFAYAPYRAVDMYVRGAVGEFWALSTIPLIFWSSRKVVLGNSKSILWLAVSIAILLTSHNISSVMFAPIIFIWIVFLILSNKKDVLPYLKKRISWLTVAAIWGVMLASFFVLPALIEKKFAHVETLKYGYFDFRAHFLSIKQLFFSTYWNYGSSEYGPYDEMFLGVGIVHWVLSLITLLVLSLLKRKKEIQIVLFFLAIGLIGLFMTHSRSSMLWLSFLSYFQFPWRFLLVPTFALSLAVGALASVIRKRGEKIFIGSVIFILCVLFYSSYFRPLSWETINDSDKFSGESWEKQLTISIFDYLPIFATHPPTSKAPDQPQFLEGKGKVIGGNKGTNWQKWEINVDEDRALVEFPIIYFPNWTVWVDGNKAEINYDNELGLIRFQLNSGTHDVTAKLIRTPVRILSEGASVLGILLIPIFYLKSRVRR